jgi:hypothetical protein
MDERGSRCARDAYRAVVLAYLFAGERLLGFVVQWSGELGDRVAKPWIAERESLRAACPPQVDVPWLLRERAPQLFSSAVVRRQSKSRARSSQTSAPSVRPIRSCSHALVSRQRCAYRAIQGEAAASGEASRMKNWDASRAWQIDVHRCALTDSDVSSRKIRSARERYHGFANRCRPR